MTHQKILESYLKFRKDIGEYLVVLPMDLKQTLEEIKNYLERNKKNE